MKRILTLILLLILCSPAYSLNVDYHDIVINFKNSFENKEEVVKFIQLPLIREYPIPDIKSEGDMMKRFREIFDSKFINYIVRSSLTRDWKAFGSQGIRFRKGLLWLDYDGRVISVNHQTNREKQKKQNVINKSKRFIHSSLRSFVKPIISWKTRNFKIRIDKIGGNRYRYAAWTKSKDRIDLPTLVIKNGKGSGNYYEFRTQAYIYKCYLKKIKSRGPKGNLKVFKNNRLVFHEPVISILKP